MSGLTATEDGGLCAHFRFADDFVGFQGHFPGRPVLPAVCQVGAVITMLEAQLADDVELIELVSAKFFLPVTCEQDLLVECNLNMITVNEVAVKSSISNGDERVCELRLRVALKTGGLESDEC